MRNSREIRGNCPSFKSRRSLSRWRTTTWKNNIFCFSKRKVIRRFHIAMALNCVVFFSRAASAERAGPRFRCLAKRFFPLLTDLKCDAKEILNRSSRSEACFTRTERTSGFAAGPGPNKYGDRTEYTGPGRDGGRRSRATGRGTRPSTTPRSGNKPPKAPIARPDSGGDGKQSDRRRRDAESGADKRSDNMTICKAKKRPPRPQRSLTYRDYRMIIGGANGARIELNKASRRVVLKAFRIVPLPANARTLGGLTNRRHGNHSELG